MSNKRVFSIIVAGAIVTALGATSAFAAAHAAGTPFCTVIDCTETGNHWHNDCLYAAHYVNDGCENHDACQVSGCERIGSHTHGGRHGNGGHGRHMGGGRHH